MKILGIETSCDETAVCIVEASGGLEKPSFKILGDALFSQVKTHEQYGGVFPALAKREHAKNLVPLLHKALEQAAHKNAPLSPTSPSSSLNIDNSGDALSKIKTLLEREYNLFEDTKKIIESTTKPDIDAIVVTAGPGLEPALWVGINFAQALGIAWNIPVIPANHMEGHIISPLLGKEEAKVVIFPALALLISGGHTELVLMKNWREYNVIGQTRDDAVGEAFDKVARLLSLPYPGGPHVSKLATEARAETTTFSPPFQGEVAEGRGAIKLPRPMLKSPDYDFSFSGIKTAVLYALQNLQATQQSKYLSEETKKEFALEFENAVTEVLITKTKKALEEYGAKTLILGGGVVANTYIREQFKKMVQEYGDVTLLIPEINHATDNAVMIAAAGYLNIISQTKDSHVLSTNFKEIKAQGNLRL
jgi:N6-L-threonylcarbamoyladenine synthase